MVRYHCPKCDEGFFREKPNINERHSCGEWAKLDWVSEIKDEKGEVAD